MPLSDLEKLNQRAFLVGFVGWPFLLAPNQDYSYICQMSVRLVIKPEKAAARRMGWWSKPSSVEVVDLMLTEHTQGGASVMLTSCWHGVYECTSLWIHCHLFRRSL